MTTIEKILKRLRERGQAQKWLARQLGVREDRISKWAGGTGEPTGSQLLRIADLLGLDVRYLADPAMLREPPPPLTRDEEMILTVVRDLKLTREDAIRRLSWRGGDATPVTVDPSSPKSTSRPSRTKPQRKR